VAASSFALFGLGDMNAGEKPKDEPNTTLGGYGVEITAIKDFDNIEALLLSRPKSKVRISLGNTLPYSKWPKDLSKEQQKLKDDGLQLLKDMIVGKQVTFFGLKTGGDMHGDLSFMHDGKSAYPWDPDRPSSQRYGWFHVQFNLMLIESGYTIYAEDSKRMNFSSEEYWEKNRAKAYASAEKYAVAKKNGLWKDGKNSELAKKLKEVTKP
jgi:hypothetical protein